MVVTFNKSFFVSTDVLTSTGCKECHCHKEDQGAVFQLLRVDPADLSLQL